MTQKILLVDDDKGTVGVVTNILSGKGYEVVSALDGKEGIRKVHSDSPDLILLDVRMPSMNGYEFIRTLRAESRDAKSTMIPIIILTAKEEMEEVFRLEGAKGYLVKPVDPNKLVQTIEECLNSNE